MKLFFRLLLILPIPALVTLLPAQTPAGEDTVSVRFMLYSWRTTLPAFRYSPRDKTNVMPDPFSTSGPHGYSGPETLNFYPVDANLDPKAPPPAPVASVTFSKTATRYVILVARGSDGRYRMRAIPEDDASTPTPSIRLNNFTNHTLAIRAGTDAVFQLEPRADRLITPRSQAVVLQVAMMENGQWRRLFNNVAELNADGRKQLIFAPGSGRPVELYSLPPWPKNALTTDAKAGKENR